MQKIDQNSQCQNQSDYVQSIPISQQPEINDNIIVEIVKKSKKQEPKIFPSLLLVDKEAFESKGQSNSLFIMKQFWKSANNKILIAKKRDTGSIVGYAIFSINDSKDVRFGNKRIPSVYLLRIGVRINCQRQGIGRKLVNYIHFNYQENALSLDVSTDNERAVKFYFSVGLKIHNVYNSVPDNVEFALFETPLDTKGKKIVSQYELELRKTQENTVKQQSDQNKLIQAPIQQYFDDIKSYYEYQNEQKEEEKVITPKKEKQNKKENKDKRAMKEEENTNSEYSTEEQSALHTSETNSQKSIVLKM